MAIILGGEQAMKEAKDKTRRPHLASKGAGWYACTIFLVVSIFVLWGALHLYIQQTSTYFAVFVNDLEIGLLEEEEDLQEMLHLLKKDAQEYYGLPVQGDDEVVAKEVFRPRQEEDPQQVYALLRHLLSYRIKVQMLTVDGEDIHPLENEEEVERVIELLGGAYLPQEENIALENVRVAETISSRAKYCYPEELYDADQVAAILLEGSEKREMHLVSSGDSLWQIAHEQDLTVEELKDANPQLNGDLLKVGEELNLVFSEPLVNVITVESALERENIPYSTDYTYDDNMWRMQSKVVEEGSFGEKEVLYQVKRENGVEIAREKISEEVLQEPEPKVVVKGTSNIPSKGSGVFAWPVRGGGRVTSGYGWRGGSFHSGVDIAASSGTPILAAESGVVVSSGWDGGYGNCIVIDHGHSYTRYAHNSKNLVSKGDTVVKEQVIAYMGSTGRSTGAHLHFEVLTGGVHGTTYNPLDFFAP